MKNIPKPKPSANISTATFRPNIKPATSEDEDHEDIGDIIGRFPNRTEEHKTLNYGYNDKRASTHSLEISTNSLEISANSIEIHTRASVTEDSVPNITRVNTC